MSCFGIWFRISALKLIGTARVPLSDLTSRKSSSSEFPESEDRCDGAGDPLALAPMAEPPDRRPEQGAPDQAQARPSTPEVAVPLSGAAELSEKALPLPEEMPLPEQIASSNSVPDGRVLAAWCAWLDALATDAEAALAAALAYKDLDGPGRDTWLQALDQDAHRVGVPRIAVYAPLLAVESDPDRRQRINDAVGPADARAVPRGPTVGLHGRLREGGYVAAVVSPLYLDFVQVLACGYRPDKGFDWVRHDPIVERSRAPVPGHWLEGAELESTPMKALVDELAVTVLAHQRSGRPLPEALRVFADLFGPSHNGGSS